MNKREAEKWFKEEYPNYKELTKTDKRLTWNQFVEDIFADGHLTEKQLYEWDQPQFIKK